MTTILEIVSKLGKLYTLIPHIINKFDQICVYYKIFFLFVKEIINFFSCFFTYTTDFH